ncbi:Uncharacterized protein QTN25_008963 [Entamoeba marina]
MKGTCNNSTLVEAMMNIHGELYTDIMIFCTGVEKRTSLVVNDQFLKALKYNSQNGTIQTFNDLFYALGRILPESEYQNYKSFHENLSMPALTELEPFKSFFDDLSIHEPETKNLCYPFFSKTTPIYSSEFLLHIINVIFKKGNCFKNQLIGLIQKYMNSVASQSCIKTYGGNGYCIVKGVDEWNANGMGANLEMTVDVSENINPFQVTYNTEIDVEIEMEVDDNTPCTNEYYYSESDSWNENDCYNEKISNSMDEELKERDNDSLSFSMICNERWRTETIEDIPKQIFTNQVPNFIDGMINDN